MDPGPDSVAPGKEKTKLRVFLETNKFNADDVNAPKMSMCALVTWATSDGLMWHHG